MPRQAKNPVVYLALSPAATATALGIEPRHVYDAIDDDELPVFIKGIKRRILEIGESFDALDKINRLSRPGFLAFRVALMLHYASVRHWTSQSPLFEDSAGRA
jgi:hypothetical protein